MERGWRVPAGGEGGIKRKPGRHKMRDSHTYLHPYLETSPVKMHFCEITLGEVFPGVGER